MRVVLSLPCELAFSTCRPPHPTFLCQNWPTGDEVLEGWTKKVAEEHKSHWYFQLCADMKHGEARCVFS